MNAAGYNTTVGKRARRIVTTGTRKAAVGGEAGVRGQLFSQRNFLGGQGVVRWRRQSAASRAASRRWWWRRESAAAETGSASAAPSAGTVENTKTVERVDVRCCCIQIVERLLLVGRQ